MTIETLQKANRINREIEDCEKTLKSLEKDKLIFGTSDGVYDGKPRGYLLSVQGYSGSTYIDPECVNLIYAYYKSLFEKLREELANVQDGDSDELVRDEKSERLEWDFRSKRKSFLKQFLEKFEKKGRSN